jgi:transposase
MGRNTGSRFSVKWIRELTAQELKNLLPEASQVLAITSSLAVLACLSHQIKTLEKAVSKRLQHTPSSEQWLPVSGIGTILAQTIALETGHIGRFPTVEDYASYCRCVNSTNADEPQSQPVIDGLPPTGEVLPTREP